MADGMDQSKFKVPRWTGMKVKALEKFPRPALHVGGCWAHGHALHLGISNPDIPKDSNTNIEIISRSIDAVLTQQNTLPLHLHLQLDNSCRENKNQKVFRWAMMLIQKGVFRSITLAFLRKGHTHEDLDGVFGQLSVDIANSTFDSIDELIDILIRRLRTVGVDPSSKNQSLAYQVHEVADWEAMTNQLGVTFEQHGGPNAPHEFRFVLRSDLQQEIQCLTVEGGIEDFAANRRHARDVFMLTRHYMSSRRIHQATAVLHAGRETWPQPRGNRARKAKDGKLVREMYAECRRAAEQGLLSQEARNFLEGWVSETLPTLARPACYRFLGHRWEEQEQRHAARAYVPYDGLSLAANHVRVRQAQHQPGEVEARHAEANDSDLAEEDNGSLEALRD